MAYIIGYGTPEEKAIIEKAGYDVMTRPFLQPPHIDDLVEIAVFVDAEVIDLLEQEAIALARKLVEEE